MRTREFSLIVGAILLLGANVQAQHLWWNLEGQKDATCLYGEVTVLATNPGIYYCGANWHPGAPAGGYCGIQHNRIEERRTIFSIWDTSDTLHPKVTAADPKTIYGRFGGEGEGGHTHMLWPWKEGETFQFFVRKQPSSEPDSTDANYYVYDRIQKKWLHSATITNPNGNKKSVSTVGGGMNSFLENFSGRGREVAKIATYRLWLGSSPDNLKCLTKATGDGTWGQLHDAYFLAEGSKENLDAAFAKLEEKEGKPVFGERRRALENPVSDKPLPRKLVDALKNLPQGEKVKETK